MVGKVVERVVVRWLKGSRRVAVCWLCVLIVCVSCRLVECKLPRTRTMCPKAYVSNRKVI